MEYTLRELRLGDRRDAKMLADMWNASESGWPGGWTGGVPETPERVLEQTQRMDRMDAFVVELNGEIVGYGDLSPTRGRDDLAYLDLLNVRPDFHGKGLGKALVLKILDSVIKSGRKQLLIGTWAGNKKSVPLYKKTGFFWIPDTSVDMQNFIPTALGMPIARDFFGKHYWYSCFKRELKAVPDDIEWNGIQVYPHHFEEDGDLFKMWIDRQAEAPTAVETNDLYVSCIVGKKEIVCGLEHKVQWEFVNKKGAEEPLQVALIAQGEEGIGLNVVENYEVADKLVVEKPFTVQPDIKPKDGGMPAHQIKSTLLLNGVPVTLGTAVKPMQPVDIQFDRKMVMSGKPDEKVVVKLKSNLDFPVKGELLIDPHPSLHFDKLSAPFSLEPKSWTSCTFYLKMDGTGAFPTKMRVVCPPDLNPDHISNAPLTTKAKTVTFLSQPLDSVYVWQNEEDRIITVETPTIWVRLKLRDGSAEIHERISGRQFFHQGVPELGPPFAEWRAVPPTYSYRKEQRDGKAVITLIVPSDNNPGITIEKTITVGAGNFIRIDHRILNTKNVAYKSKLRCGVWSSLQGGNSVLTMPLKDGLLHEPREGWGGFPMEDRDLPKKTEEFAESWSAIENSGLVAGIVFDGCEECEDNMTLQFDLPEIPSQSYHDLESFYLVTSRGNWEVVRQLWRWLKQPSTVHEECRPPVHPALNTNFDPAPLLITRSEMNAKLAIRSLRGKSLNGKWQIEDGGLKIEPASGELSDIKRGNPSIQDVALTIADLTPRVETTRVTVAEDVVTNEFAIPAIVLGNADRPVTYSSECPDDGPAIISFDNSHISFTVAPTFLGSVTALECDGVNHLKSSYPEAGPYVWLNPWFGGIHPHLGDMWNQRFTNEKFTGEPVEHTGKNGIIWRGVKVGSDIQHKDDCWLRMEVEYLTIGCSNVLAIVQRLINKTDAPHWVGSGVGAWLAVGGSIENNVLHYTQNRPCYEQSASTDEHTRVLRHRRRDEYRFEPPQGRWVALENPETGHAMAMIPSHPKARVGVEVESKGAATFFWNDTRTAIEPNETKEMISWLVLTDSVENAQKYRVLEEICELP